MFNHNSSVKIFSLIIIFVVFLSIAVPALPHYVRASIHQLIHSGVRTYLSYNTRQYQMAESEHFILKYSDSDQDIAVFTLDLAEQLYASVKQQLDYHKNENKILLVIYPDQASLNRSFGLPADKSAAGVYWAGSIRILSPHAWYPTKDAEEEVQELFSKNAPLSHELTHLFVDRLTKGNYTRWLTEGLAQYIEEKTVGFRLPEPLPEQRKALYPLTSLDRDFDQLEDEVLVYWQSLQTVEYLLEEYGMERMHVLLNVLEQGTKINKALLQVYGLTIEELEKKTEEHVKAET